MKWKNRIQLYQIKLIDPNSKSYSRACRCSSQVYFYIYLKWEGGGGISIGLGNCIFCTSWPIYHEKGMDSPRPLGFSILGRKHGTTLK